MCKTKFLQMRLFSIILTSLHSSLHLNSLHHPDSSNFLHFHPDSPHSHADSPRPHSHPFSPQFPHSDFQFPILSFTDSMLTQFVIFQNFFQENSCFSSKTNTPLCYYCITLGTKLLFTSYMTIICEVSANNSEWLKRY